MFVAQHTSGIDPARGIDRIRVALGYNRDLLLGGQVWRSVTPTFLHVSGELWGVTGLPHLLINMSQFALLGPWAERAFGPQRFVALYLVSGTVAFGWLVWPEPDHYFAGGGSGGLYGVMAALLVRAMTTRQVASSERIGRIGLAGLTATHLWFNVRPLLAGSRAHYSSVAPLVHIGGFITGLALGIVFTRRGHTSGGRT